MQGLMQNWPLLVTRLIEFAAREHGGREIVTLTTEGPIHRYTYADCHVRAKKAAQAFERFGIKLGDRVATLAWNTYRHVELWYGLAGMGAIAHTVNPRLFKDQITYIANHAEDRVLCLDISFVGMIEEIADDLKSVEAFVIMTDEEHMPKTSLKNAICYETLIAAEDGAYDWPDLDENTACGLCYTSGTTGHPKGVLYSHRSNVLMTMASLGGDVLGMAETDVVMPIVPMFHANAWAIPYGTSASGAKLILNGPNFDGETIHNVIEQEQVTITAGVPTVWLMLLDYLKTSGKRIDSLNEVVIGGSAAPRSMIEKFERDYGVNVRHAWGMTEMSPIGTVGGLTTETQALSREEQWDVKCKQGRALFGVEMRITNDDGDELPRDGEAFGHLEVRGPWIAREYFKGEGKDAFREGGWFDTGDVATIDPMGYMQITDRAKDVIKSGGEWISSIDLENAAVGHPDVQEAAVIGVAHPKWDERPLLIVVSNNGKEVDRDSMISFLTDKIAKWWLPDDVVTIDEIPHTATGKILKTELRERFKGHKLPTA